MTLNQNIKRGFVLLAACLLALLAVYYLRPKVLKAPERSIGVRGDIVVNSPKPGEEINSPVKFSGKVLPGWFFEGGFPVKLVDANGKEMGMGLAKARGDWMALSWVDFSGQITYNNPVTKNGALIFLSDNPSGDPAKQKEFKLPINFATVAATCSPDLIQCKGDAKLCMEENKNQTCN